MRAKNTIESHNQLSDRIRILVVDDHPLVRESLKRIIQQQPDWEVCGETDNSSQALELVAETKPHLVILDLTLTIPLIASSIMSKKIAEGTSALVLDVKVGVGAFMKYRDHARELATTMVGLGSAHGVNTVALLTAMDTPLGRTAGNALEVAESLEVLAGGGPDDVVELTLALAREMLAACGLTGGKDPADAIADGSAMDSWNAMIRAQGGDPAAPLPVAPHRHEVVASAAGRVVRMDALAVGVAAWRLGAGRARKEDAVSFGAGVQMHAKPGDVVTAGSPLFTLHADDEARFDRALDALTGAVDIAAPDAAWSTPALVLERVGA